MSFSKTTFTEGVVVEQSGTLTPSAVEVVPGGTANTKTTVVGSQTTDRTVTLPDATDTLVARTTTDTLTNKTINADLNTITNIENADIKAGAAIDATKIADGSVSSTEFQYLSNVTSDIQTQIDSKAPGASAVTLTGVQTLSNKSLVDNSTAIIDNSDATKQIKFDAAGSTATSTTLTSSQTLDRVLTLPDATDTLVGRATTDTLTNKTLTTPVINAPTGIVKNDVGLGNVDNTSDSTKNSAVATLTNKSLVDASTAIIDSVDATKQIRFDAVGTTGTSTTLTSSQTANRVVTIPDATTTLVGTDVAQVITNKDIDGGTASNTSRLTLPKASKATLDALTRKEATLVYGSDTDKVYYDDGSVLKEIGSGSGEIDFLANGRGQVGSTTGWATYNDGAVTRPIDGTGGVVAGLTIASSATAPLRFDTSLILSKDAANRQGEGFSYDFTVNNDSKAKVLAISKRSIVNSGTFVAGGIGPSGVDSDVIFYMYDVTNSRLIEPSSIKVFSNSSTISDDMIYNFQTSPDSTSYRLIVHIATTSAAAWTLKMDMAVTPSNYIYGTPISDYQLYIPTTNGFGTITGGVFRYRRTGDSIEIEGGFTPGTVVASSATISLPTGVTVPSDYYSGAATIVGTGATSLNDIPLVTLVRQGVNPNVLFFGFSSSTQNSITPQNGNAITGTGGSLTFNAKFRAPGYSSSVQMSDNASTRIIAARYASSANGSVGTSPTLLTFATSSFDTHAAFNGTTFTCPSSGFFQVATAIQTSAVTISTGQAVQLSIFKNGSAISQLDREVGNAASVNYNVNGTDIIQCNAGDTLDIRANCSVATTLSGDPAANWVSFKIVSGPAAIAATETIAALYTGAPPTGTLTAAFNTVTFGTKVKDTHNVYSGGAYTIPTSGQYDISAQVGMTVTTALGNSQTIAVFIDGVARYLGSTRNWATTTTATFPAVSVRAIPLLAGQVVTMRVYADGTALSYRSSPEENFFSITRSGNY